MPTLRQMVDGKVVWATGTSEGATKGWDARGRKQAVGHLEEAGYKKAGGNTYEHPKKGTVRLKPEGGWLHKPSYDEGSNASDLHDYLTYGGEDELLHHRGGGAY